MAYITISRIKAGAVITRGASAAYDAMEIMCDPSHVHALTIDELRALGDAAPVDEPRLSTSLTADVSLKSVLDASFPETCSRDDIHALFHEDAVSCADRLGFAARLVDGEVKVSYPMSTAIWSRR